MLLPSLCFQIFHRQVILSTWERKSLWRLYGPIIEKGVWRIRANQKLRELYKSLDLLADIKWRKL
jgi:hypothetical protein